MNCFPCVRRLSKLYYKMFSLQTIVLVFSKMGLAIILIGKYLYKTLPWYWFLLMITVTYKCKMLIFLTFFDKILLKKVSGNWILLALWRFSTDWSFYESHTLLHWQNRVFSKFCISSFDISKNQEIQLI